MPLRRVLNTSLPHTDVCNPKVAQALPLPTTCNRGSGRHEHRYSLHMQTRSSGLCDNTVDRVADEPSMRMMVTWTNLLSLHRETLECLGELYTESYLAEYTEAHLAKHPKKKPQERYNLVAEKTCTMPEANIDWRMREPKSLRKQK